jgi:hypothetical protein
MPEFFVYSELDGVRLKRSGPHPTEEKATEAKNVLEQENSNPNRDYKIIEE